jgi:GT2 family glycosyltransferase
LLEHAKIIIRKIVLPVKVHITIPFSIEKNLGKAYNEAMQLIPDDDWMCFLDYDAMLLTPDAPAILHEYATRYPDAALLTCYTNRIHQTSQQLLFGQINENDSMRWHLQQAIKQKEQLYQVSPIHRNVSGFLMLISKKSWLRFPFSETGECLGVDTEYWKRLREAGQKMYRMDGLYCWHTYRLLNGINDKTHLQP